MFVTLFYSVLDPSTGMMTYSNAGHIPPYILNPAEGSAQGLPRTGMPLGVDMDAEWQRSVVQIPPGAALLLYTDGITDAQNQSEEFYGEARLLEVVRGQGDQSATAMQDALISSVYEFAGGEPQVDDITLMVLVREKL